MPTPSPFKLYWHSSSKKNVNPQTPPCLCELKWGREGHVWSQTPASLTSAWGCHNCCNSQHIKWVCSYGSLQDIFGSCDLPGPRFMTYLALITWPRKAVFCRLPHLLYACDSNLAACWDAVVSIMAFLNPIPIHPPPELHHCLLCFWLKRIRDMYI